MDKKGLSMIILVVIAWGTFLLNQGLVYAETKSSHTKITTVSTSLKEKKEIIPNVLKLAVEASTQPLPKEIEVINLLGTIDKKVKDLGVKYQGGRYNIYKNCQWIKDKQVCYGYKGFLSYVFELKDPNEQTKVYSMFEEAKKMYGDKLDFSVTNTYWTITEKDLETITEELKLTLITKAIKFAEKVSTTLNKSCHITTLNLDQRSEGIVIPKASFIRSFSEEKTTIEPPSPKQEQTVELSAYVVLSCY
ncbi:hypothetical protein [Thermodesulfobacterium hveragerdense]|uniref:hypothetical protein n=1 Tax=Thermodesulfobacterium hveragerdense TaxID=53424 RepID=UPI000423EB6A|nr:hypothetical protein [Thermodesulfobacterium hveragerdense]